MFHWIERCDCGFEKVLLVDTVKEMIEFVAYATEFIPRAQLLLDGKVPLDATIGFRCGECYAKDPGPAPLYGSKIIKD
jgi:hypothetical protein